MKNLKTIGITALVATAASIFTPALAQATKNVRTFVVTIPSDTPAHLAPSFTLMLGMPMNGSCDHLAKTLGYDEDTVLLAKNKNGEAYCLLDNVETVREEKK